MPQQLNPIPGESVASFFKRNGKLSAAARLGAEKNQGNGWEQVSLQYKVRQGDRIRVRSAKGGHSNANGLRAIARAILLAQKR